MRWDTEIAEKFYFQPHFQYQACFNLNTSLKLEPNAYRIDNYIFIHILTFSLGKGSITNATRIPSQVLSRYSYQDLYFLLCYLFLCDIIQFRALALFRFSNVITIVRLCLTNGILVHFE